MSDNDEVGKIGWFFCVVVADVNRSAAACTENGGKIVVENLGGSVAALYQP